MSRSAGPTRRSGDPRKRAAQPPDPASGTGRRVAIAVVAAVGLGVLAFVLMRPAEQAQEQEQVSAGREHADVACDLTSKAQEAASVETDARLAAAVLLLDQAIAASARAVENDAAFTDLDEAVQAVHTAAHQGDPQQWQAALDTALAECRTSTG